jgi:hypothetical protein
VFSVVNCFFRDQGGIVCIDGQCVLPCGGTGPINSCNDGG